MEITSGPAMILASGTVTAFLAHPVIIKVTETVPLQVEFHFKADPDVPGVAVETEAEGSTFKLICVNFDKDDGRGSAVPVLLGTYQNLVVLLHFRVFLHGRTEDRTVHFTLYAVDDDEVDWKIEEDD